VRSLLEFCRDRRLTNLAHSLAALGVYQPNVATNQIDSQPVQCHLYEHTTQMSIAPDMTFRGLEKGIVPCQIMFALKEKKCVAFALSGPDRVRVPDLHADP